MLKALTTNLQTVMSRLNPEFKILPPYRRILTSKALMLVFLEMHVILFFYV